VSQVRYTTLSQYDIIESADFYKSKSASSEQRFVEDLERTAAMLLEFPALGEQLRRGVRRFSLHHFPYFLYYVILPDGIRIVAVAHQSRHPSRWNDRLR
jgi:plasmid stabilization system protein ParE